MGRSIAVQTTPSHGVQSGDAHWFSVQVRARPDAEALNASWHPLHELLRLDAAHAEVPRAHVLCWQAQIGFHSRLADSIAAVPPTATGPSAPPVSAWHMASPAVSRREPDVERENQRSSESLSTPALQRLIAEAAHDIRSPIDAAYQMIALVASRARLSTDSLGDDDVDLLEAAQLRLMQASEWADGVLLHRSLELGQPACARRRFYPQQWLELMKPLIEAIARKHAVRLNWVGWDRSLSKLYLDPSHLSRAVLNLVSNAIIASQPGDEVSIRVDWQRSVAQRLVIAIEDVAGGLPRELLPMVNALAHAVQTQDVPAQSVQTQNVQTASSETSTPNHIGIGLQVAKRLIAASGGVLQATLTERGTLMRITLPVDHPASLIRGWLMQNAASRASDKTLRIVMHAVRVKHADVDLADSRLQLAAGQRCLAYRVADDRWLWFTFSTTDEKECETLAKARREINAYANAKQGQRACLSAPVFDTAAFDGARLSSPVRDDNVLSIMVERLNARVLELSAARVPPTDNLLARRQSVVVQEPKWQPTRRIVRADVAKLVPRAHFQVIKPAPMAASKPPAIVDSPANSALSNAMTSGVETANSTGATTTEPSAILLNNSLTVALRELADDWQATQEELARNKRAMDGQKSHARQTSRKKIVEPSQSAPHVFKPPFFEHRVHRESSAR